jgi:hypothetical protein
VPVLFRHNEAQQDRNIGAMKAYVQDFAKFG